MYTFTDPGAVALGEYVLGSVADPDAVAVVDYTRGSRRELTYGELRSAVRGLGVRLGTIGVVDRTVGVLTENSIEFVIAYFGVLAAGGVVLPLDPRDPQRWPTLLGGAAALVGESVLGMSECGVGQEHTVVISADADADLTAVADASGAADARADAGADGGRDAGADTQGGIPWEDALRTEGELPAFPGGERAAVVLSSSGSVGKPKRVTVTHHNLVANLAQIHAVHRVGAGEAVAVVPPLRHIYGMQMALNPVLRAGGTLVLPATPLSIPDLLDTLRDHRVTLAYLVPSVLAEIGREPATGEYPAPRRVVSGGAPLPDSVAREAAERLGVPVVQGFGMTEAGCLFFSPDDRDVPAGSVGIPVPGTDIRIADAETGQAVGAGEPGELWVRGPQVVPAGDDPSMVRTEDGFLRTGDLITQDADGFVRIVGRLKAMIKYKGHQVSPAVLEEVLLTHPAVREAKVSGVPDPVAGELPRAHVVLDDDVPLADLVRHVSERVAPAHRIRMIERVGAIPRSATGKPQVPQPIRALISGGSRGLGRAFATALAAAGAAVTVLGRDEAGLLDTTKRILDAGGTAGYAVADILDRAALITAVDALDGIDVLVNNAGIPGPTGKLWEVDESDWWHTMEVNLRGTLAATRAVLPRMSGRARVINIVSEAGRSRWPHAAAYSVSKAAIISLTSNLAAELRGTDITTVAFDPGLVDIGITRAHFGRGRTGDPWADRILDWAEDIRDSGGLTPLDRSTRALVDIALGSADHVSGGYVTVEEGRIDPGGTEDGGATVSSTCGVRSK
ncbi:SDR family NAD(P)-dependent oxidoreductase [Nocardia alni]|uniref:SDR family NAD(P)-dependent oxidoreductase n=1 Tax=Nocardia alni TaxID=2815723 RepID=UPI001C238C02|nr:SDR family NAD(P)-dependent oxidoreductase [Nocardia alni]